MAKLEKTPEGVELETTFSDFKSLGLSAMLCIRDGPVHYCPWAKSGLLRVFENKVLLKHRQYIFHILSMAASTLKWQRFPKGTEKPDIFTI